MLTEQVSQHLGASIGSYCNSYTSLTVLKLKPVQTLLKRYSYRPIKNDFLTF